MYRRELGQVESDGIIMRPSEERGGLGPFTWSISAGALPTGLLFNTATGVITGIPAQAGTFPLTVQVTDALGGVDAENLTLTIN